MNKINKMYFPYELTPELSGYVSISTIKEAIDRSKLSPFELRRLEFYALICITEGEVNHFVGDKKIVIKANQCFLATKGEVHSLCKLSDYNGYMVIISDTFVYEYLSHNAILLLENCCANRYMLDNIYHTPNLNLIFKKLLLEFNGNSDLKLHHIGSLISIYLLKIMELEISTSISKSIERAHFLKFEMLVTKNFAKTRNIKEYAKIVSISNTYLNIICKKISGVTAKKFIANIIIDRAILLLTSTSMQYKEIAEKLGFKNASNFYSYFKKHTLNNPSDYRGVDDRI